MAEIWFYHLQNAPLEKVLPNLLERSLERGWKAVIQATSDERVDALDATLWTYAEDAFLAHGTQRDGDAERQPVWLTTGTDNPNGAKIRFLVEGADVQGALSEPGADYDRVLLMFNGNDDTELGSARAQWKVLKEQGHALAYWQQTDDGRWVKKA